MNLSWRNFPLRILTKFRYQKMKDAAERMEALLKDKAFLKALPDQMAGFFLQNLDNSSAQLAQDLFVLWETQRKKSGYFVEVGACDGRLYSNTLLLEERYEWKGILVEPARKWHASLKKNRKCKISHEFVAGKTGEIIDFCETSNGEFSTGMNYSKNDMHASLRSGGKVYQLKSISLTDLLRKNSAPAHIDYLSLDTEGSELEILQGLDFEQYDIRCITCEHNFTPRREEIFSLLKRVGFVRKYEAYSSFDDWYFKA